jgi:uncharacterized protein YfkK (UPF0435 family)
MVFRIKTIKRKTNINFRMSDSMKFRENEYESTIDLKELANKQFRPSHFSAVGETRLIDYQTTLKLEKSTDDESLFNTHELINRKKSISSIDNHQVIY